MQNTQTQTIPTHITECNLVLQNAHVTRPSVAGRHAVEKESIIQSFDGILWVLAMARLDQGVTQAKQTRLQLQRTPSGYRGMLHNQISLFCSSQKETSKQTV